MQWHGNRRPAMGLASFPGSNVPECEHWSCAGVESLVFFLTWEVVKDRREVDTTLIVCGHMRLRTEKGMKVADNLLHVSSYQVSNIIHTEHWSIVGWTTCKTLSFCFCPILITSCLRRKIPGSPCDAYSRFGRAWERGYNGTAGDRLVWCYEPNKRKVKDHQLLGIKSRTWAASALTKLNSPRQRS